MGGELSLFAFKEKANGTGSFNENEVAAPSAGGRARGDDPKSLFSYWQRVCGHPNAKSTRDRLAKIAARLREGYSPADVRQAFDGAARGAYVDEGGKRHDGVELICRNGAKLEDFMNRATITPPDTSDAAMWGRKAAELRELGL